MRPLTTVCLAVACVVVAADTSSSQETDALPRNLHFSPDVPTVWHKLGVSQGVGRIKKFRESRVNRKGNHPEREKKPRLLKIADAANLAPDAPKMLQAAAQIKKAEDLAPQKIKALKYLATIGCGCYNKKNADMVEAALLEGLEDCTPEVRTEALNVVLAQVSGQCQCSCTSSCNESSCCTEKLYKKMEELAHKTDDTGCPIESDPAIRCLAKQVLNACPYPMMTPDEEPEEAAEAPPKPKLDEAVESGDEATETDSFDEEVDELEEDLDEAVDDFEDAVERKEQLRDALEFETPDTDELTPIRDSESELFDDGNDGDVCRPRRGTMRQAGYQQISADDSELLRQLEVTGRIRSVRPEKGSATIVFDAPYNFPAGLNVVLASSADNTGFGVVERSKTGASIVRIQDTRLISRLSAGTPIRLGVFE